MQEQEKDRYADCEQWLVGRNVAGEHLVMLIVGLPTASQKGTYRRQVLLLCCCWSAWSLPRCCC